jgi:hypothetical protein
VQGVVFLWLPGHVLLSSSSEFTKIDLGLHWLKHTFILLFKFQGNYFFCTECKFRSSCAPSVMVLTLDFGLGSLAACLSSWAFWALRSHH